MSLQTNKASSAVKNKIFDTSKVNESVFSKDYVDFLNDAGWRLEKKFPSNRSYYSDLLEDTDWKSNEPDLISPKHYRRDLDALS